MDAGTSRVPTAVARVACLCLFLYAAGSRACDSDSSALLYTVPPSCTDIDRIAACNASLSLCTSALQNATSANCSSAAGRCATDFVRCMNTALLELDVGLATCGWVQSAKMELLVAIASLDNSSALNDTNAFKSCQATVCRTANQSCSGSSSFNQSDGCAATLAELGNLSTRRSPSVTPKESRSKSSTLTLSVSGSVSLTRAMPTMTVPSSDASYQKYITALNESVTATAQFVRSLIATAAIRTALPLPDGCPQFLAAFAPPNRSAVLVYSALAEYSHNSTNSTLLSLVALGESTIQVSFQPALYLATALPLQYNVAADLELNRTIEALRVLELALDASSPSLTQCMATPAPPTSPPPPLTTQAPTEAPTTATTAEPTEAPTLPPPTSTLPNLENETLPPTEQLVFHVTVRNSLTYPYSEDDLFSAVLGLLGISSNQLKLSTLTNNITLGVLVDVEFTFLGGDAAALQSATLALTSAQLSAIGIITLQSAPVQPTTDAPSFLVRSNSLIWVGGAGLVGAVALFGGAGYCISERRRRQRQLERAHAAVMQEDDLGDGIEINLLPAAPLRPSKRHHHHHQHV